MDQITIAQRPILRIQPFQKIGNPIRLGKITVQLCAMPRHRRGSRVKTYRCRSTVIPHGQRFYPFKLGYIITSCDHFLPTKDLYNLVAFELLFERKVRFLNALGELVDVKRNTKWESNHLQPLECLIRKVQGRELERNISIFM